MAMRTPSVEGGIVQYGACDPVGRQTGTDGRCYAQLDRSDSRGATKQRMSP